MIIDSLQRLLLGSVLIYIEGGSPEVVLNYCHKNFINITGVKDVKTGVTASVLSANYSKLVKIRKKSGCKIRILKKQGLYFTARFLFKRASVAIGIAVFFALIALYQTLVWDISFYGISNKDANSIKNALYASGVYEGSRVNKEKLDSFCESYLKDNKKFAWISLNFKKGRLVVEGKELEASAIEKAQEGDIYAAFDGIIKQIKVYEGFTKVLAGQSVAKGDLIVSKEMLTKKAKVINRPVMGEIIARGEINYSVKVPLSYISRAVSAKEKNLYSIILFNKTYPLYFFEKIFIEQSIKTTIRNFEVFSFKFPFCYKRTTVYEIAQSLVSLNEADAEIYAEYLAYSKLQKDFKNPLVITSSNVTACDGKVLTLNKYYLFEADISKVLS